jgi:STE24 endopeptidase
MIMLGWLIGIYTVYILLKIYLSFMQAGYINREKKGDPVLMPAGRYIVAGNYAVAKEKLAVAESFVEYLLFMWWILGGLSLLQRFVGDDGSIMASLIFLLTFFAVNYVVMLPFEIYSKFKIDQSFGFNKTTVKMYLADTLKSIALFLLFGGLVLALLSWIVSHYELWWLWGFVLLFGVTLLINLIYPTVIAPIFNKFTPLEDGRLKESIERMMESAGLHSEGIFVMDAGKRDSRLNAYFG